MNLNIINEDSKNVKLAYESLNKVLTLMNIINIKNKSFKSYLFLLIFILMILINYLVSFKYYRNKYLKQIISIEKYYKICNNGILINKKSVKKEKNPEISIIATTYSKEKYISRFLRSIQNQNFDSIEIIIIDDFSDDNSTKIIKTSQKEDYRIILINNNNNKGTLISRNEGILISRGKYIMTPDIDDILSYNIINQCFIKAEKNNYDMIKFNTYLGNNEIYLYKINKNIINKSLNQPELSYYIFYGSGNLKIIDPMISNKFVKRDLIIEVLNRIDSYYLNKNMIFYEDFLINFMLYKISKFSYYSENLGYYYISNPNSSTKNFVNNTINTNKLLNSLFLFLKYIFDSTKNNIFEKDIANAVIEKEMKILLSTDIISNINTNYNFFDNIINLYLNNTFIHLSIKNRFIKIKEILFVKKMYLKKEN